MSSKSCIVRRYINTQNKQNISQHLRGGGGGDDIGFFLNLA